MSHLFKALEPKSSYVDRQFRGTLEEYQQALAVSSTIYVGNLSFYTTEEQIWELFSKAGEVRRIIMGLNRERMSPCGFAFVEYYTRRDAENCVKWINGTKLDDRVIRTDFDFGFVEGRQYGRGKSGGQIRDELREDYDPGRGGYGIKKAMELTQAGQDIALASPQHLPPQAPLPVASAEVSMPPSNADLKRKREDDDHVGRSRPEKRKRTDDGNKGRRSRSRSYSSSERSRSRSPSRSRSRSRSRSSESSRSRSRSRSRARSYSSKSRSPSRSRSRSRSRSESHSD